MLHSILGFGLCGSLFVARHDLFHGILRHYELASSRLNDLDRRQRKYLHGL